MWNDEDNNPYGAFDDQAHLSESLHSATIASRKLPFFRCVACWLVCLTVAALYDREYTPPSPSSRSSTQDPPDYLERQRDFSDDDDDDAEAYGPQQPGQGYLRKNVYDSRIEQILYENPGMSILITDAGKNHEGGGGYIVYTIRTGVCRSCTRSRAKHRN